MARTLPLPTQALTPSRVPAEIGDYTSPFFRFDGYQQSGDQETLVEIMHRAQEQGLDALALHELRIEYFRTCRAQRHGGGPYGEDDVHDQHKRAILDLVHERVCARGGGLVMWTGDITTLYVDVTVTAANRALAGGSGVDGAIHKAAGPKLLDACQQIEEVSPGVRCPVGEARLTPAFDLPSEWVVHAVGPVWKGGESGEAQMLAAAYRASLDLASEQNAESIAIPAISTGAYGYPGFSATTVAVQTCRDWRLATGSDLRIVLVAYDETSRGAIRAALDRLARP